MSTGRQIASYPQVIHSAFFDAYMAYADNYLELYADEFRLYSTPKYTWHFRVRRGEHSENMTQFRCKVGQKSCG